MKNNFNSRNLFIGFGLSLIILLASSTASYLSIQNLLGSMTRVTTTQHVLEDLEKVISSLKDAETGQRGYLLTKDEEFLEDYHGATETVLVLIASIKNLSTENPEQQKNIAKLEKVTSKRLKLLDEVLALEMAGEPLDVAALVEGKDLMDDSRFIINEMQDIEERRMEVRMEELRSSSEFTPMLIILACILAILITIFFYLRIRKDFQERSKLQAELESKDEITRHRINVIQDIAEKISSGNYEARLNDSEKDGIGSLAFSLNQMASSLQTSFEQLADNEWLQASIAAVNDAMVGEKDLETLANDTLKSIIECTESSTGAFYLLDDQDTLSLYGSYALNTRDRAQVKPGQGLIGQVARDGKEIIIKEPPRDQFSIIHATAEIQPAGVFIYPVFHEKSVKGVIEITSINPYTPKDFEFIRNVARNIGIAINSAENRKRLNELLEETRSQSEELQVQHSELENMNAELESQTQQLQASEEELKVQQDELMQANQELEERTKLLEEKNQVIIERNQEIKKTAEELAQSTRYKSEFMANMSHELRTPLNSILLLSRLLVDNNEKNLTDEQIEYAEVIQSSGKGLLNLIDEILDLSKIEAGKMDLEYEEVTVTEITEELNGLFKPVAIEKNLDFKVEVTNGTPKILSTDKSRFLQILKNLISNALKFTSKGSVTLQVSEQEELFKFKVIDTGIGITDEQKNHIFEAFRQADGSTRRKYGGTGLGLSISRELVRLLGGKIELESKEGAGSTFTVIIPSSEPSQKPLGKEEDMLREVEILAEPTSPEQDQFIADTVPEDVPDDRDENLDGERVILIVEDDTNFANALLSYSHKLGYKGIVTVRGDKAVADAIKYNPKAILLDIVLPVKSGWEVMDELKTNPRTRHIPVHIMSSLEAKRESLVKGAVDYISKPFAFSEMKDVFTRLEQALTNDRKKVLIVEENTKHSEALSYFLGTFNIRSEILGDVEQSINALQKSTIDCVILHTSEKHESTYDILEKVNEYPELEDLPIIVFTGENLTNTEERRIKKYADSIVVKTAESYRRILDEVALFLHLIESKDEEKSNKSKNGLGNYIEVLKGKKVLVADDDVRNIYSITKTLEKHEMKVISAIDGKDALKQLDEHSDTDVVLMDIMMPELDGYQAIEQIRKDKKHKNLPILAITAKAMKGDREKCIQAGASDYISKPVDMDQLISLLRVWLYGGKN